MQRGVGEHGIKRRVGYVVGGIGDLEAQVVVGPARGVNHIGRAVDTDDLSARLADLAGQVASATAEVQDALPRPRHQQPDPRRRGRG